MGQTNPKYQTMLQRLGFNDADLKTPGHDQLLFWLKDHLTEVLASFYSLPTWDSAGISASQAWARETVSRRLEELPPKVETLRIRTEQAEASKDDYMKPRARELRAELTRLQRQLEELASWPGLADPPPPVVRIVTAIDERPIVTGERNRVVVGYADLFVQCDEPESLECIGGTRLRSYLSSDDDWLQPRWSVSYKEHRLLFEVKTVIPSYGELMRQMQTYASYVSAEQVVVSPDDRFAEVIRGQKVRFVKYPGVLSGLAPVQPALL